MSKTSIFILLALLGVGYQNYQLQQQQNILYEILTDMEAERLEKSDKTLTITGIKADYKTAIKLLSKPYKEYSQTDKTVLKHCLGTVYQTRHREELNNIMPSNQTEVNFALEEVKEKYKRVENQ